MSCVSFAFPYRPRPPCGLEVKVCLISRQIASQIVKREFDRGTGDMDGTIEQYGARSVRPIVEEWRRPAEPANPPRRATLTRDGPGPRAMVDRARSARGNIARQFGPQSGLGIYWTITHPRSDSICFKATNPTPHCSLLDAVSRLLRLL